MDVRNARRRHLFAWRSAPTGSYPPQPHLESDAAPPPLSLTPFYRYLIMITLVLSAANLTPEVTAPLRSGTNVPANPPAHPALSRCPGFEPTASGNPPTSSPMCPSPPTALADGLAVLRRANTVPECRPAAI